MTHLLESPKWQVPYLGLLLLAYSVPVGWQGRTPTATATAPRFVANGLFFYTVSVAYAACGVRCHSRGSRP